MNAYYNPVPAIQGKGSTAKIPQLVCYPSLANYLLLECPLPDLAGREAILKVHAKRIKTDPDTLNLLDRLIIKEKAYISDYI